MSDALFPVGEYTQQFNIYTGQSLPCGTIYQSFGLEKHIRRRHPNEVGCIDHIPEVITSPDYIGKNPSESNSVELVKRLSKNLMVCVKLDAEKGYFFVASIFPISEGKVQNRLNSGRLKLVDKQHKV